MSRDFLLSLSRLSFASYIYLLGLIIFFHADAAGIKDKEQKKNIGHFTQLYISDSFSAVDTDPLSGTDQKQAHLGPSTCWKSITTSGKDICRAVVISHYRKFQHFSVIHTIFEFTAISAGELRKIGLERAEPLNEALDSMAFSGQFGYTTGINDFDSGEMSAKSDIDFTIYPGKKYHDRL